MIDMYNECYGWVLAAKKDSSLDPLRGLGRPPGTDYSDDDVADRFLSLSFVQWNNNSSVGLNFIGSIRLSLAFRGFQLDWRACQSLAS